MTSYIDGLTGRKIDDPSLAKSDGFFFLSEQGNLETEKSSGTLYVFPHKFENFKLTQKELPKPIDPNAKEMFDPKADQSYSDLLILKKKENTFLQRCLDNSSRRTMDCDDCSVEFIHQCKALQSLLRYIQNSLVEKAIKFLDDVSEIQKHFQKQSKKLIKNGESIYMNMYMNDIIPELAKGEIKSMTQLVPMVFEEECKNETQVKVLLQKHSKSMDAFRLYVDDQLNLWKSVVNGLNDKTKETSQHDKFVKFVSGIMTPFIPYQDNINISLEKMRNVIQEHTSKINQIEEQQERFSKGIGGSMPSELNTSADLPLITDLMSESYTDKVRDLDKEIIMDLSKCTNHKFTLDQTLLDYFTSLLQTKERLQEILKKKKRFSKVANQAINESLRNLLFFQNLPSVYDRCCSELIRRNRTLDNLKSKLYEMDQLLRVEEEKENKERVKFLSQAQDQLGGSWRIPKDLISSIENKLEIPKLDLSKLDPGLPSLSILENSTDQDDTTRGWDVIGDDDWDEMKPGEADPRVRDGPRRMTQTFIGAESEKLETFYNKIESRRKVRGEQPVPPAIVRAMRETMHRVPETEESKLKKEIAELTKQLKEKDEDLRKREELIGEIRATNHENTKTLEKQLKDQKEIYEAKLVAAQREATELKVQSDRRMKEANDKISKLQKQLMSEKTQLNENFQVEFEKLKKEKEFLIQKLDGRAKQVSLLEGQVSQASLKVKQMKEEIDNKQKVGSGKQKKFEEMKRLLEEVLKSNEKLNQDKVKANVEFTKLQKMYEATRKVLQDVQREKLDLSGKLDLANRKKTEMIDVTKKQANVIQEQHINVENLKKIVQQHRHKVSTLQHQLTEIKRKNPERTGQEEEEEIEGEGAKDIENISLLQQLMKKYGKKVTKIMSMGFKADRFQLLAMLLKHDGDIRKVVNEVFSLDEKERKLTIGNQARDAQKMLSKFIAIRNFSMNDPVLFSKKGSGLWEAFNIYEDVKKQTKPTLLLHEDCVRQIHQTKKNATLVTGNVIQYIEVNILKEDPLKFKKGNYVMCVVTGITKDTVF